MGNKGISKTIIIVAVAAIAVVGVAAVLFGGSLFGSPQNTNTGTAIETLKTNMDNHVKTVINGTTPSPVSSITIPDNVKNIYVSGLTIVFNYTTTNGYATTSLDYSSQSAFTSIYIIGYLPNDNGAREFQCSKLGNALQVSFISGV